MRTLKDASWSDIQELRKKVAELQAAPTLLAAAQAFSTLFAQRFDTVVLARVFMVLPFSSLPSLEREFARKGPQADALGEKTPVLCLMGSAGRQDAWNERLQSEGHLAIPLGSSEAVRGAPMIAQLLADLQVNLQVLDDGRPIATRELMGGRSRTFFVADALTDTDAQGRLIIAAHEFAQASGVRSVFGTGGSYMDGTLVVAILFCSELLERETVDRFASFIGTFKLATARLLQQRRLFDEAASS